MASEKIRNAVALMRDADLTDWIRAAVVYTARAVIVEDDTTTDHETRLALAKEAVLSPDYNSLVTRMQHLLATDPEVFDLGNIAEEIGDEKVLERVGHYWTPLAKLFFPA